MGPITQTSELESRKKCSRCLQDVFLRHAHVALSLILMSSITAAFVYKRKEINLKIETERASPQFSTAGIFSMKNHEKSGGVLLISNLGQVLTAGCEETPGKAHLFISDQSKEVSQDRERRRKLHRCIKTAIHSARRD